jgi:integrase
MPKPLTHASVLQMRPDKTKRRQIADGGQKGLYLYVYPSGAKSWVLLLTQPIPGEKGKYIFRKLGLGAVDLSGGEAMGTPELGKPMTLAGARWLVAEMQHERGKGHNVIADRRAKNKVQKVEADERNTRLFAVVAERFIDEYARPSTRRWKETAHILGLNYGEDGKPIRMKGGLAESWGDKEITTITSDEVYHVVDDAKRHGIPGLPRRTKGISDSRGRAVARTLSKMFGWALQHRKIKASPSVGVFVPPAPKSRDRVLSTDEIVRFWRATDKVNQPFGPMLKLLLLTGARLREVAGMRRCELSEDGETWTLPGTRTKNKRDHAVPLSRLARDILANVKQASGKAGFVFSTTGRSAVSGFSKTKRRLDELMLAAAEKDGVQPWRLHDLRRTAASGMQRLGVRVEVIERALNHVSGAYVGVTGTYQVDPLTDEVKAALERWAAHIDGLVKGRKSNVTSLNRKKGK